MNPNASKNRELIKQYPFVSDILSARMEPHNGQGGTSVNDLTIRVEKADGDLMFRRADNVGLGDSSGIFQFKGNRKDQVMRRGEYLFAIDGKGKIVNRVNWPRNDEEKRKTGEIYGWSALWTGRVTFANNKEVYSNPIWDKVRYLVWVTVEAWHADTKNDDVPGGRFGEFKDRLIHITIYSAPDQGFEKLREESSAYSNLVLDSRLMTRGVIEKDHDIVSIGGMLYEMCITFQDEVYFNGMKDVLDTGPFRGASGQFGMVKVLCAEMCGYDRVMLEDNSSYVTFQLRPGSKHMYVLGQQGTLPQIRNLVRTVVRM
ncbi:hypothetical protein A3B18_00150 [Candidatus Giovannonibacteria bacterium RIFCSPLOWO2_01_FULL_46_13]|uniref:Uncharacterized protein n=1 Tax=Candidatus Giovannonibacteria bacterium RIFCSPLOWO2_01_FULL_46_13 TaxID=1798352 RepID=A0A1F5X387_9BACT|nr:MAG: hypothetical protein A3B18_00150 [Candidatus Giovannonibacteria bacterium RIFCSPLOWO2_01_FULL_46_13]